MIPILYDMNETAFESNGLGRLRDTISAVVTEERNGIYEFDFEYPVNGAHYEDIQVGRIVGVTHDESGDIQPFDIVSYSKPIDGVVAFHCTHISYRLSYVTKVIYSANSLAQAFSIFEAVMPEGSPFLFRTDKTSTGYLGCSNDIPKSIRSMLGGIQGSILDSYGGEYEWDKWIVYLHSARGQDRDFSIRYGVNMLDYNEEYSIEGTFSSCFPYWTDGTFVYTIGTVDSDGSTLTGRKESVPLDLSDKFESLPSEAELRQAAQAYMNNNNTFMPIQNIHVEFARLQDTDEYTGYSNLLECNLCDTINVIFPDYNASGQFKIVKTVWDVLRDRYESMELGDLSVTLAEALGISNSNERTSDMTDFVVAQGTDGIWTYRKWNSGIAECWGEHSATISHYTTVFGGYGYNTSVNFPTGLFATYPKVTYSAHIGNGFALTGTLTNALSANSVSLYAVSSASGSQSTSWQIHAIGRWK